MYEEIVYCDDCGEEFSPSECLFAAGGDDLCRPCHDKRDTAPHDLSACDWCQEDADNEVLV